MFAIGVENRIGVLRFLIRHYYDWDASIIDYKVMKYIYYVLGVSRYRKNVLRYIAILFVLYCDSLRYTAFPYILSKIHLY